jgi:hypothetical protein
MDASSLERLREYEPCKKVLKAETNYQFYMKKKNKGEWSANKFRQSQIRKFED